MSTFSTPQEEFWAGEFGEDYIQRNIDPTYLAANLHFFGRILSRAAGIGSVLELGPNVGMNLRALRALLPGATLGGVEINPTAAAQLRAWGEANVYEGSILDFTPTQQVDLAFTKGVMIHINPAELTKVYDALAAASRRYVLIAEYYNPAPTSITYRGHEDRLFKRDFAGEFMDRHPDFALVDYGFAYRRDPQFPQDDITWFLLEK